MAAAPISGRASTSGAGAASGKIAMRLVIESINDLDRAERLVSWLNRASVDQVLIALPWIDGAEQRRIARRLKRYFNDCGCLWGAAIFVFMFICSLSVGPWSNTRTPVVVGVSVLVSVPAALAAKLMALAWSYWRLKVLLNRMKSGEKGSILWH